MKAEVFCLSKPRTIFVCLLKVVVGWSDGALSDDFKSALKDIDYSHLGKFRPKT